ncbi:hypothetical protein GQ472_06760 [archaeon]|nr:hypothetical protein [archaeon]
MMLKEARIFMSDTDSSGFVLCPDGERRKRHDSGLRDYLNDELFDGNFYNTFVYDVFSVSFRLGSFKHSKGFAYRIEDIDESFHSKKQLCIVGNITDESTYETDQFGDIYITNLGYGVLSQSHDFPKIKKMFSSLFDVDILQVAYSEI